MGPSSQSSHKKTKAVSGEAAPDVQGKKGSTIGERRGAPADSQASLVGGGEWRVYLVHCLAGGSTRLPQDWWTAEQRRPCHSSSASTRSCHVYGVHRAHTLCTHTLTTLSRAFTSLNMGTILGPALNSYSTLFLLFPCPLPALGVWVCRPTPPAPDLRHLATVPTLSCPHQDMPTPHPNNFLDVMSFDFFNAISQTYCKVQTIIY